MDKYLPAVQSMNDIIHAVNVLVVVVIGAIGSAIAAYVYQWRVSLPRRFEQQNKERDAQLAQVKQELENKHAAQAVDIERERMFPVMVENNQRLVESMIKLKDADTAATLQRIELDKTTAAILVANTNQLTTHTDRLEETTDRLEAVEKQLSKLYNKVTVAFPNDINIEEILQELRGAMTEIKKACADKRKGDSKELPIVTLPAPPANVLYDNILPDDLEPTG